MHVCKRSNILNKNSLVNQQIACVCGLEYIKPNVLMVQSLLEISKKTECSIICYLQKLEIDSNHLISEVS